MESDALAVREIVSSTGFFHPGEVEVAVELVRERLARGEASGYRFLLAEDDGGVYAYACFGPTPCTLHSFDLYWIAVHGGRRGRGVGPRLLALVEERILAAGGARLYAETSVKAQYAPTRSFYERCGFGREAVLRDFYAPGDDKVIYCKVLRCGAG